MHQKKWIVVAFLAIVAIIGLTVLNSSASTYKISPDNIATCCKTLMNECKTQTDDEEIIHKSLSRQFL